MIKRNLGLARMARPHRGNVLNSIVILTLL